MNYTYFLLISLIFFGCVESPKSISSKPKLNTESIRTMVPESDILQRLSSQFTMIENASVTQKLIATEYFTVGSSNKLLKMDKWPEEYSTFYIIYKDSLNNVLLVEESPFSESGDWEIFYQHYFDKHGKTFAFKRQTNFFNSICNNEDTHETIIEYFDSDFVKVGRTYYLVDEQGKELKKEDCVLNYDFEHPIFKNRKELLNHINVETEK